MQNFVICLYLLAGLLCTANSMLPLNKTECLEWHNIYRAIHQAPSLNWSDSLAADAQIWANTLASSNKLEHDDSRGLQGENLYWNKDNETVCKQGTHTFYKEGNFYDYDQPGSSIGVGHFTQLVWVSSKELGVAKANTSSGLVILVYRYFPSGNYLGEFAENVKRPLANAYTHKVSLLLCLAFAVNLLFVYY